MTAVSFTTIAQPNPRALVLIEVPESLVAKLGAGKRVPVRVALNGVDYRSTIAVYGGRYYLPARKEICEKAKLVPGGRARVSLEVDAAGLDGMDRRYLITIAENYGGGPVGIETIAAALSEPRDAIEEIIEPFLIQKGFLQRTPRGRLLTSHAFRHLGLAEPARDPAQFGLFGEGTQD